MQLLAMVSIETLSPVMLRHPALRLLYSLHNSSNACPSVLSQHCLQGFPLHARPACITRLAAALRDAHTSLFMTLHPADRCGPSTACRAFGGPGSPSSKPGGHLPVAWEGSSSRPARAPVTDGATIYRGASQHSSQPHVNPVMESERDLTMPASERCHCSDVRATTSTKT